MPINPTTIPSNGPYSVRDINIQIKSSLMVLVYMNPNAVISSIAWLEGIQTVLLTF